MKVTVTTERRPGHCTCPCGCEYVLLENGASVRAGGVCFSCRVELHAGRRDGWKRGEPGRERDAEVDGA